MRVSESIAVQMLQPDASWSEEASTPYHSTPEGVFGETEEQNVGDASDWYW